MEAARTASTLTKLLRTTLAAVVAAFTLAPAPALAVSSSYNFDFAFGSQGSGPGQLSQPQGIAVDPSNGNVFVADTIDNRVEVFSPAGVFLRQLGSPGSGNGQLTDPAGVGVSPLAPFDVYVADTNDNRIERFANDGTFISAFGTNGGGAGQVEFPRFVAFDPQGNVYVGDTGFNNRITRWSAAGAFQSVVSAPGAFQQLGGVAASTGTNAQLFATDARANSAQRLTFDGTGGGPLQAGILSNPHGIGVDSENGGTLVSVFVGDTGNHRVAVFGGGGPFVRSFGSLGPGEGQFQDPSGVAFSSVNNHVYVAEGNNCCTKIEAWKQIPDPVLGQSMDIQTDAGTVLFKPPGAKKFSKLKKVSLVKSGTIIDARHGTVGITSLTATGQLQSADFYSGIFKAIQKLQGRGLTDAQLFGGNFKPCPAGLRAAKVPQTIRKLWGSGSGQFRTKGRFAAASIRGTTWLTDDRCDGTLIRVTQGAVTVRDLAKKRTVVVKSGQQYFARAPRRH